MYLFRWYGVDSYRLNQTFKKTNGFYIGAIVSHNSNDQGIWSCSITGEQAHSHKPLAEIASIIKPNE